MQTGTDLQALIHLPPSWSAEPETATNHPTKLEFLSKDPTEVTALPTIFLQFVSLELFIKAKWIQKPLYKNKFSLRYSSVSLFYKTFQELLEHNFLL